MTRALSYEAPSPRGKKCLKREATSHYDVASLFKHIEIFFSQVRHTTSQCDVSDIDEFIMHTPRSFHSLFILPCLTCFWVACGPSSNNASPDMAPDMMSSDDMTASSDMSPELDLAAPLDMSPTRDSTPDQPDASRDLDEPVDLALPPDMTTCEPPSLPTQSTDTLVLGMAGAPVSLFGPEDAPTFEDAYTALSNHGFNYYMPIFITREVDGVARGTRHFDYFLPASITRSSPQASCDGNPESYAAMAGKLNMLFPGFLLLPPGAGDQPLDANVIHDNIMTMRQECWREHESVIGAIQSYDEPALFSVINEFLQEPALLMDNVTTASMVFRQAFPGLPIASVEGPLPLLIASEPSLNDAQRDALEQEFWPKTQVAAEVSDWYGFNVYPVPDFSLNKPGDYVRDVVQRFPSPRKISVLQGFSPSSVSDGTDARRGPTAQETRYMIYDSIVGGAEVIFWWGSSTLDLDQPEDALLWEGITSSTEEVRRIAPILTLPRRQIDTNTPDIEALATVDGGTTYLILVNRSDADLSWEPPTGEVAWDMLAGAPLLDGAITIGAKDVVLLMLKSC